MAARGQGKNSGGAPASPKLLANDRKELGRLIASLPELDKAQLLLRWRNHLGGIAPAHLPGWLLARVLAFRLQAQAFGDVSAAALRKVQRAAAEGGTDSSVPPFANRAPATREGVDLRPGAMLAREWRGKLERVTALEEGFAWNGKTYGSLSQVAKAITGTSWNGHRFFGLRSGAPADRQGDVARGRRIRAPAIVRAAFGGGAMKPATRKANLRCAIYTRVSSDSRLEQEFNSLDNQREASEAYIKSQAHEGWKLIRDRYDDGGFSGGSMERPALQKLLEDVRQGRIDVIVVYKVDRLTRSLADFAKLVELFDEHDVSFVSVTQAFNTTTSMGRLTLNVLLSFAQFEREVTGERIRDKIAASKKKGIWMGGVVPLGYRVESRALHIVEEHAEVVRSIFRRYLTLGSVVRLKAALDHENVRLPIRIDGTGKKTGGGLFSRGHLYKILSNPIYIGRVAHRDQVYEGQHPAIVDRDALGSDASPARRPRSTESAHFSFFRCLAGRQAL